LFFAENPQGIEHMGTLSTVILAAGASRRLGYSKLTLKINGEAVIHRTVRLFTAAGVGPITVVTGFEKEALEILLSDLPVSFAHNPAFKAGMSSSVKAALPTIEGSDLVFFHLGDKPFVTIDAIRDVLAAFEKTDKGIIVPVHNGEKGHPVLIDVKKYLSAIESIEGEGGLRDLVKNNNEDVLFLESGEGAVLDLDSEEDVMFLRRRGYSIEKD
jgi:molybdenum cofactor cytidylyltransferase